MYFGTNFQATLRLAKRYILMMKVCVVNFVDVHKKKPRNVEKKGPKSNICLIFGVAFVDLYSRTINFFLFLTDERYHHLLTKILRISLLYSSFYRVHLTK